MVTRDELKAFRIDFQDAVKELEKKYQVNLKLGAISYTANEFHGKVTATKTTPEAKQANAELERLQWKNLATFLGMKEDDYGKSFRDNGKVMTIIGINPKSRKYPILLKADNGKVYNGGVTWVKFCMANNAELGL